MKYTNKIYKAMLFAKKAHADEGQKRKYTGDDYIVHPISVASLLSNYTDDENMLCAALLHDTLEDTKVTETEIREAFGDDVLSLVLALTDVSKPTDGGREIRKNMDRQHSADASPRAQTIKYCDLIDNTHSITRHDPGFAKVYMKEKELLLDIMNKGDPRLLRLAKAIVEAYKQEEPYL